MKRASSPPEATFIRGASGVPGLAATMNSIRSMPDGPGFPASVSICRFEARPLQLERRQFGHHRLVERLGRLAPLVGQLLGGGIIGLARGPARPARASSGCRRRRSAPASSVSKRSRTCASVSTVHLYLRAAARSAKSRSSDFSSSFGSKTKARCASAMRALGLADLGQHPVERLADMVEPAARRLAPPLELAQRRVEARHRRAVSGERFLGIARALRHIARPTSSSGALRRASLPRRRWGSAREVLRPHVRDSRARPRPAPSGCDARSELGLAPRWRVPQGRNLCRSASSAAEGIEQAAVGGDVDQRAVGVLAVDLGQRAGDLAQQIQADRLVVDGGTARAIGILDAADDQFAVRIDALLLEDGEGRMRCAAARRLPSPRRARHPPAPAWSRRARPAPGPAHRAGWICRRRSRR